MHCVVCMMVSIKVALEIVSVSSGEYNNIDDHMVMIVYLIIVQLLNTWRLSTTWMVGLYCD